MRKALIITYYWPPSGGSAVLRWLKFSKYLRDFGWEPVIYTPQNPEPQEIDDTLLADVPAGIEVIKTRIFEPYGIYKILTGRKPKDRLGVALMSDKKSAGIMHKMSLWIRSNLFIPDPRIFWVKPSVKFLTKYIRSNPVDIIITTGPPHSMHLIGLKLKQKTGVKWVADFRDPWTNIDFYRDLKLSRRSDRQHHQLEKTVLLTADHVVTVSPGMTSEFKGLGIDHVSTITNGFDEEPSGNSAQLPDSFNIVHLGSMPKSRNPEILWAALETLIQSEPKLKSALKVHLVGKTDSTVFETIKKHQLQNFVVQHPFIPHSQAQGMLSSASVLLLCINNTENAGGILTNKFFEYLSAQQPVIAIGPVKGDAAIILEETGAGKMFNYHDVLGLKQHLSTLFQLYLNKQLKITNNNIDRFSRRNLTRDLSILLNKLTNSQ